MLLGVWKMCLTRVEDVLGRAWEQHVEGHVLKQEADNFKVKNQKKSMAFFAFPVSMQRRMVFVVEEDGFRL